MAIRRTIARTRSAEISLGVLLAVALFASQLPAQQTPSVARLIADSNKLTKSAKTVDDFTAILQVCKRIAAAEPDTANGKYATDLQAWAHNRIGEIYVKRAGEETEKGQKKSAREYDDLALRHFEIAIKKNPDHWKARHNRGVSYGLLHRYADAVRDFSAAIKRQPEYINSWFNRAEIYYELARYDRAISDYSRVLRKTPNDVSALIQRGHAYFRSNQIDKSVEDYVAAVKHQPDRADCYVFRGDAYQSQGQWRKASLDYRAAIKRDVKNAHAFRSSAWLMATCPDERFRDQKRGIEAAELAAKLYVESDYRTLDALAAAYANASEFDKATEAMEKAIQLAPRKALDSLAQRQQLYENRQPFRQPTRVARARRQERR